MIKKVIMLQYCGKVMYISMLSFRVGGQATHGNLIQRAFPWVGILTLVTAPGSGIWHVRHLGRLREPGNKSSTIIPTYLTINLVLKLFVFHLSLFLFPFNTLFLNHNCKYYISTIYHRPMCYLYIFTYSIFLFLTLCDQVHRSMTLQYYLVNLELHCGKENNNNNIKEKPFPQLQCG